jgi:predicted phage terminase large subunit-like protein
LLTAEVIEGFVGSVLAKRFDQPAPIPECHREWWGLCTSPFKYVAIAAPRGFAKSTAITHSYVLASVLFRARSYVLIISGTEAQSIQFLSDIKHELIDNDHIKSLFKIKGLIKDSETDIICEFEDGHKFRIQAKGSEQRLRGVKWAGKRPDLVVCDDIEDDEQVMSKERREKFRRWFYGALIPCLSVEGVIRVVGTILHMDSLLERLMPEFQLQTRNKRKMLVFEELKVYTNHTTPWRSIKYRAHSDDFEALLWKERISKEYLIEKRQQYIDQGLPDVYSQEYLNIPIDESLAFFKQHDFVDRQLSDKDKVLRYYISGDLAISEKDRADYSAFVVGGMDDGGILHIVHVVRERMNALEIIETILALEKTYKPEVFTLEEGQITKAIGPFLYEEMPKRGIYPNIIGVRPSVDKMVRARSIQARMRARACRFDKDAEWYQTFKDECLRFPRDKHDDQVDAFAYLGLILDKMVEAPTKTEIEEEEYADELRTSGLYELGRSEFTGY